MAVARKAGRRGFSKTVRADVIGPAVDDLVQLGLAEKQPWTAGASQGPLGAEGSLEAGCSGMGMCRKGGEAVEHAGASYCWLWR